MKKRIKTVVALAILMLGTAVTLMTAMHKGRSTQAPPSSQTSQGMGESPSALDSGIDPVSRQRTLQFWTQHWTYVESPAPSEASDVLFGQWVNTDPAYDISALDFHRNGRLDVHYVDGQTSHFSYAFWAFRPDAKPGLFFHPWRRTNPPLPNPDDPMWLDQVTIAQEDGRGWLLRCTEDIDTSVITFERVKD